MRTFLDWVYIGSAGYAGFSVPGFTQGASPASINVFLQSDPVLRVHSTSVNTRWCDIMIETTAGWYDTTDPLHIEQHVYLEAAGTIYVPLREALAPALQRRTTGLSLLSPTPPMAVCDIRVDLLDSTLTSIDSVDFHFSVFDALGDQSWMDWRSLGIPDTWRVARGKTNYFCIPMGHVSSHSVEFAATRPDLSEDTLSMVDDGTTICFAMTSARPYTALTIRDTGGDLAVCRVVWEECLADKINIRWWSPQLGGWKSYAADVVAGECGVTERTMQQRGFGLVDGVDGNTGFSCRFPRLTHRDWLYFRDILLSDEIYIDEVDNVALGGTSQAVSRPVRVSAQSQSWRLTDTKDFDFSVIYDYISEL